MSLTNPTLAQALLSPRSIAIVGASDHTDKASSRPLHFLRSGDFGGKVFAVNARRDTVAGERAYPSLRELPEVPEHAFVMVPAHAVIEVITECADLGVGLATILSGGFAEDGPAGLARQDIVREVARGGGVRLLGPNSLGLVNLRTGMRLTGNAVFARTELPVGGTFVASQSGSMIGSLFSRALRRGIGFSSMVSVGGEIDLSVGEICALSLDDPAVTGYLLFLESIRHADDLAEFARLAADRNKPVVAYKVGRSRIAAELALSHTGALVGQDDVAEQLFADFGIARTDTLDGLLEAQPLLARLPIGQHRRRVGVVTTTGGGAAMVVDQLGVRGVDVVPPSADTYARLAAAGVGVAHSAIVDLTLAGTRYDVMKAALDVLLTAPEFDLVLAVAGSSARLQPELVVAPIVDAARSDRPLAAFLVPDAPEAYSMLSRAGVPVFQGPETCADVISAALTRRTPGDRAAIPEPGAPLGSALLNEDESYLLIEAVGVPVARRLTLDVLDGVVQGDPDVAADLVHPLAVKALVPTLAHKSDAGAVLLGVTGKDGLAVAVMTIADNLERAGVGPLRRVLVQPMVIGVGELLVGYQVDAEVGPMVVVAAGGVLTEIYRDRSVRLAPVTPATARDMLQEVRAVEALRGYRGTKPADLDAAALAISALSQLATRPEVVEAEINPLLLHEHPAGVTAVDALVRVQTSDVAR